MARWYIRHGSWWMLQWVWPAWWWSLGIHIDPRVTGRTEQGKPFGPYLDLHVWMFILSLGRNPVYTHGDTYRGTASRGGVLGSACTTEPHVSSH